MIKAYDLANELRTLHGHTYNDELRAWELVTDPLQDNQEEWMFLLADAISERFDDRSQSARLQFVNHIVDRMVSAYEITD